MKGQFNIKIYKENEIHQEIEGEKLIPVDTEKALIIGRRKHVKPYTKMLA